MKVGEKMRERGLLAIVALAALLAFAFLFSGVISASETEPGMLYDEQGNLIGMKVDQAQARREMSTDMLQDAGRQIEAVDAGQKTLRTFSSGDEPIPMEPPFAPDVLVYTSATADDTPRMAFNPTDGLLWVTFTHFNGVDDDIIVFYSDDVGATWSFSVQTIGAYNERNPSIAIAGNTIIIFYEQDNLGNEQHTFFIRSKDGGLNWEGPLYMDWAWTNDPAYAQLEDFNNPDVSVVRPQWFHFTADAWGVRDATRTVSFMWTETDGDSWSMVYWTIGWHLGEDFERPVIMENSADDMIHNAYQHWNTTEAGWDIEWLIVDHGLTTISGWWTANLDAGNTEISPDISIRDDYVYLVWQNGTATPDLTAFYSDDGGSASLWILPIRSNDGFDQMYPAVYLDTSYVPHISAVNDTSITYLNNTDIFTQPWSEVKADDFPGWTVADFRATDIIYELNNPRIVFTDARLGAADIWYTDLGVAPTVQYTITRSPLIAQGDIIIDGSILCSGTCVYDWTLGETHTLEAPTLMTDPVDPANVRYSYSAWSDGGAQTHQITVGSSALTLTAIYDPQYNITFETLPDPNLDILIDTVLYTAPQSFWFTAGQLVTMDVPSPQTIDATSRYVWQSWSDGGLQSHLKTISMVETFTATFAVEYLVNVNTNPAGLDVDVDGLIYNLAVNPFWWLDGSTHDLNAISPQTVTPDEQWAFVDWSDGGAQVHPVTVIGPATYTANYTTQYKISFTTSPAGLDVEVDGVLNDTGAAPVNYFWDVGSVHTICAPSPQTINPTSQYEFLSWNDGGAQCHDITVTAPATYTANFGVEYRIDVNTSPMIRLNITVDAIEYTAPYSFWCAQGSPATLGAPSPQPQTPTMRYSWVSWSDGGTQSHPIICTMANAYTATFVPQYLLNFSTDPQGLLIEVDVIQYTAPHTEWYDTGATVSINAPSPQLSGNTQAVYRNWNDGQPQSHLITVTGTATYIAYFDTQYLVTITSTPVTGLSVEVDGFLQTTEYQFWCDD
ncbi:MAG: sialidase family protein, partial [Thermoplasmata archaeon]